MAFDLENLVRDNIKHLVPYSSARSEFGGEASIFLDANENAFGSPIGNDLSRYPDPNQSDLKERLSQIIGVARKQIFVGNGSDEAIDLLIRVFCRPGVDEILICPPTYGMYEIAAATNDVAVRRIPLTEKFDLDAKATLGATTNVTKIIFVCSPNNPTGNSLSRRAVLDVVHEFDGIVVVDEAYIHYATERSFVEELDANPNLVILQTFSKAWGLAGLRVGLAFASTQIVEYLNKVKPPYNIGRIAQDLTVKALDFRENFNKNIAETIRGREFLANNLPRFRFVKNVYPSDANFLLVKVSDAGGLYKVLLDEKIVVRNRNNVTLCEGCLRITVGTSEENRALMQALEKYETSSIY